MTRAATVARPNGGVVTSIVTSMITLHPDLSNLGIDLLKAGITVLAEGAVILLQGGWLLENAQRKRMMEAGNADQRTEAQAGIDKRRRGVDVVKWGIRAVYLGVWLG